MERKEMFTKYREEIDSLYKIGKDCYDLKYLIFNDGEISKIVDKNIIIITESGAIMNELTDENICFVDFNGNSLLTHNNQHIPKGFLYHLKLYNSNRNLKAIIHSCPPALTAVSIAKSGAMVMQELKRNIDIAPIPKCFTSEELLSGMTSDELNKYTSESMGILIKDEGALFYSDNSIYDAFRSMYVVENMANSLLLAWEIQKTTLERNGKEE